MKFKHHLVEDLFMEKKYWGYSCHQVNLLLTKNWFETHLLHIFFSLFTCCNSFENQTYYSFHKNQQQKPNQSFLVIRHHWRREPPICVIGLSMSAFSSKPFFNHCWLLSNTSFSNLHAFTEENYIEKTSRIFVFVLRRYFSENKS